MLIWALQRARQGDRTNEARIRRVLTLMADTMIDKDVGAMNQVNLKPALAVETVGRSSGCS